LTDGHGWETVGYLAISSNGSGSIPVAGAEVPYLLQRPEIGTRFAPVLSWTVRTQEEQSQDLEWAHPKESVDILALGRHLFGQDVSSVGEEVHTLRRLDPEPTVAMEWGTVDDVGGDWVRVPLAKSYDDPVVVAKIASSRDMEPGTVRVRNVGNDFFEVRFEEWSYLDGVHSGERIFYIVAEKGRHQLAGLEVEAGALVTDAMLNARAWETVALTAPFVEPPAVFTSVQSQTEDTPVTTRIFGRRADRFHVALQEEEAAAADGRLSESVGWIAVEMGTGVTAGGRGIEILATSADHEYSTTHFASSTTRAFRTVVADMADSVGWDPATVRHDKLVRNAVDLVVQEETSMDPETYHIGEDICLFVAE
jgi:hypothetical protein